MTPTHLYVTQCQVPGCGKKFEMESLGIPVVGKTPQERATAYVTKLAEHMQRKHPERCAVPAAAMMHMFGLECLKNFTIEDPALLAVIDETRRALHVATRGKWVDDRTILDRAARLGLNEDQQREAVTMLTELRDYLCEVKAPENASVLVTPNGHS